MVDEILLQWECRLSVQMQPSHSVLYQYSDGGLDALYSSAKEVVDAYRERQSSAGKHSRIHFFSIHSHKIHYVCLLVLMCIQCSMAHG